MSDLAKTLLTCVGTTLHQWLYRLAVGDTEGARHFAIYCEMDLDTYLAAARMVGCNHARTSVVDLGVFREKCRDCWAIRGSSHEWTPHTMPPDEEVHVVDR